MSDENCGIEADHLNDIMAIGSMFIQQEKEAKKLFNALPKEEQELIKADGKKFMAKLNRAYAIDVPFINSKGELGTGTL